MKVLVACEYSAVVRDAFRARGFDIPCGVYSGFIPSEGYVEKRIKPNYARNNIILAGRE